MNKKELMSISEILILLIATFAFAYLINPENIGNRKENSDNKNIFLNVLTVLANQIKKPMIKIVSAETITTNVCCEKTNYGAWCQNAPESQCDTSPGLAKSPTSCDATSFCREGCCYDSSEGTCAENTPQRVCNMNNGTWADSAQCEISQCELGCCVLGSQAAFVTLTRCKKLSSFYGLQTNFQNNINNELECIAVTQAQDRGACVYEVDYIRECEFTTRGNCKEGSLFNQTEGAVTSNFSFYKDWLCSAEELGTRCGLTKDTICVPGKDEVYFVDSCGNPANIYDASKVDDKSYWKKIIPKAESCGFGSGNANSASCGNCDYFLGSFCKNYKDAKGKKPTYGNNICADLSCPNTYDGTDRRNGESWCVNDEKENSVGSRYFRHMCINGQEIVEPCADFRNEICIQDKITTDKGEFSQAGCRVNMWQECTNQENQQDCMNIDKRDCKWIEVGGGGLNSVLGNVNTRVPVTGAAVTGQDILEAFKETEVKHVGKTGVCVPKDAPGFIIWEESDSKSICAQANSQCIVSYEKKGFGLLKRDEECIGNCECLPGGSWEAERKAVCESLGDCGGKTNYLGTAGYRKGYGVSISKIKEVVEDLVLPLLKFASYVVFSELKLVSGAGERFSIVEGTIQEVRPGTGSYSSYEEAKAALETSTKTSSTMIGTENSGVLSAVKGTQWITVDGINVGITQSGTVGGIQYVQGSNGLLYSKAANGAWTQIDKLPTGVTLETQAAAGPTSVELLTQNWLVGNLIYGLAIGGLAALIAGLVAPENSNADEAFFWGGLIGGVAHGFYYTAQTGKIWSILGEKQAYHLFSEKTITAKLGANPSAAAATTQWLIGAAIGIAIMLVIADLLYKEERKEVVTFNCKSWEAPVGGNDCEKCNSDPENFPCSEYRCKSLGQACELLNAGTDKETCDWVNRKDVSAPGIKPMEDVLLLDYKYTNVRERPPGDGSEPGRMTIEMNTQECVKAFTPLSFGIITSEPSQCKIDYVHTDTFEDMSFDFGETNLYLYNHTQIMSLPGPENLKTESLELENDGTYTLYVRCMDANGNTNKGDPFAIRFCVDKGPDITPPSIEATSIINGMPVQFNLNDTILDIYVNEPAECRWTKDIDADYENMKNQMVCQSSIVEINNNLLYKCSTILTGIQNQKENIYYFRCKDQPWLTGEKAVDRNVNREGYKFSLIGTKSLNILNVLPDNETIRGSTTLVPVTLKVETANGFNQGDALCFYSTTKLEKDYIKFFDTGTNLHTQRQDLVTGKYTYYIKCVDLGGNTAYDNVSFEVLVDKSPPVNVRAYNDMSGRLKIVTDEKSSCTYSTSDCNFIIDDGINMPYANTEEHYAEWLEGRTYYIRCKDGAGNEPLSNRCSIIVRMES